MFDTAKILAAFASAQPQENDTNEVRGDKLFLLKSLMPYMVFLNEQFSGSFTPFNQEYFGDKILSLTHGVSVHSEYVSKKPNVIHSGLCFGKDSDHLNMYMIYKECDHAYSLSINLSRREQNQYYIINTNDALTTHLLTMLRYCEDANSSKIYQYFDMGITETIAEVMQKLRLMILELPVPQNDGFFTFCEENIAYLQKLSFGNHD